MKIYKAALFLALAAFSVTACSDSDDATGEESGTTSEGTPTWKLVWTENFDGKDVDTKVWGRIPSGSTDWSRYMSTNDAVFEKTDSSLILKGIVTPDTIDLNQPYMCGGIDTRGRMKFVPPFRVEVRCKMSSGQGVWPAIWMMPYSESLPWPDCGEVDIMEHLNHDSMVYQSIHSTYFDTEHKDVPPHSTTAHCNTEQWNTYGFAITKDALVWYINGAESFRYPRLKPEVAGQYPFYVPQFLRIDMQIGGAWVGSVNPAELPAEMEIDWVKYYRYE